MTILNMEDDRPYIITIRHKSPTRKFWRELFALLGWGAQQRIYSESAWTFKAPFGVLGHENFSVSNRKENREIEISYFEELYSSDTPEHLKLHREIEEAVVSIIKRNTNVEVYARKRGTFQ